MSEDNEEASNGLVTFMILFGGIVWPRITDRCLVLSFDQHAKPYLEYQPMSVL